MCFSSGSSKPLDLMQFHQAHTPLFTAQALGCSPALSFTYMVSCALLMLSSRLVVSVYNRIDCSMPGSSVLYSLPEFAQLMPLELIMLSNHLPNHLNFCSPLLLLPSTFLSIRVFSNELALHIRWPKFWSFSFSISPSKEYSELISFRIDWFGLLAVQGTLRSLLQHHCPKASVLQCSVFFMVPCPLCNRKS